MSIETKQIIRVVNTPDGHVQAPGMTISSQVTCEEIIKKPGEDPVISFSKSHQIILKQIQCNFKDRPIYQYVIEGGKAKIVTRKTIDGERSFVENASTKETGKAYEAKLQFSISPEESIYGLGQQENGTYCYRNTKEYLYQNNMMIPMPVFLSSAGYAILLDADCLMQYEEQDNIITITFDAVDQVAYYVIMGDDFDQLIGGIRTLTGKAVMLPKWAFGYVQSKERYVSQEDILNTAKTFEERQIPVSCLVLDWKSWEEGKWGNKRVDKARFPDLKAMTEELHSKDIGFMVSIWPNMNKGCEDNLEMIEAGKLLANLSTYNAFDPAARDLYWIQCNRELFPGGTDAWWCDSTEPFTPDWNGLEKRSEEERYELAKENLTRYFDARQANHYALQHAKGIYEHQRATSQEKRVLNLTRSGSISIQQYGVVLWSGDIMATWQVLKNQIAEGLSICMCGIPYWTLDIGAFFAGSTEGFHRFTNTDAGEAPWFWHGDYEGGVADKGYCELYTRWLQFGTFLPMMRSHGTDTPREPWQFQQSGQIYYDTIVDYIKRRYQMMPYTYSLAHQVEKNHYTIMRSLMFDFAKDPNVRNLSGEFMYGSAYLVCPVTDAMEFGPNNKLLNKEKTWDVYLPAGAGWYHELTGQYYEGGAHYQVEAPISWQPVFIRTGAIIPMNTRQTKDGIADTICVYEGQDGQFCYYQDNGQDYSYEQGNYASIDLSYDCAKQTFTLAEVEGEYKYPDTFTICYQKKDGTKTCQTVSYEGKEVEVEL